VLAALRAADDRHRTDQCGRGGRDPVPACRRDHAVLDLHVAPAVEVLAPAAGALPAVHVLHAGLFGRALRHGRACRLAGCRAGGRRRVADRATAQGPHHAGYPGSFDRTDRGEPVPTDRPATFDAARRNDAVVNLSKRRGFVFASSEIYGGTRSAWTTA